MVNTRSKRENKTKEGAEGKQAEPTNEIDLETPDQSVDEVEKKMTESTPMPNVEEPNPKSMEFSPIDTVEDTTGNTPETVKDESQAKRTSFTERLAMMVGIESRDIVTEEPKSEKGKTFGTVSTKTTETNQDEDQLQQMSDKVEATDGERHKNIKKDMQEMKQRYDAVNSQLGSLETRMDTMRRDQAESSCAIQAKLDAILRNSTSQDRPATDRTQGIRVDFVEP